MSDTSIDFVAIAQELQGQGKDHHSVQRHVHRRIEMPVGREVIVQATVSWLDPDDVIQYLEGTCNSTDEAAEAFDIPEPVVLEIMESSEVERCAECDWWCESHEVEIVDDEYVCADCRQDEED